MKKSKILFSRIVVLYILSVSFSYGQVNVSLDEATIKYEGAFYTTVSPSLVTFDRHTPVVYNDAESGIYGGWIRQWVITQTGVRIRFKTASPTIQLSFQQRSGGGTIGASPTNGFTVFADSSFLTTFSSLVFTINNPSPGSATYYEVSLPNLWAVDLIGLQLAATYSLVDPGQQIRPVYVAFGDSKTHGTGQYVSSAKTYPFQLASMMKWNLYNCAVAGSSTGWPMAWNVKGKQVDYVTIEFGYNDWKYLTESLAARQSQYERLIDSLRLFLPSAKIICITPLVTTDAAGTAHYTLDEFRDMVTSIVKSRQQTDLNLFLIPGPAVSNSSMLASGDPVHLSESGALALAVNLKSAIEDPSSVLSLSEAERKSLVGVEIEYVSISHLNLVVNKEGNYLVEVFSLDGKLVGTISDLYLEKGRNEVSWKGIPVRIGNPYLICIQKEGVKYTELKVVF